MQTLAALARFELIAFTAALAALVGYRLLTGAINTRGLLFDKVTGKLSPERIQLLVLTLVVVATFPLRLDQMIVERQIDLSADQVLPLIGTSHLVYLAGKFARGKWRHTH